MLLLNVGGYFVNINGRVTVSNSGNDINFFLLRLPSMVFFLIKDNFGKIWALNCICLLAIQITT